MAANGLKKRCDRQLPAPKFVKLCKYGYRFMIIYFFESILKHQRDIRRTIGGSHVW